jgi:hypothetical protein
MTTVLDFLVAVLMVIAILTINALAGVLAHKLSKLYDYQSDLRVLDVLIFAFGIGWVMLVGVGVMLVTFRKQGLHWHNIERSREVPWRDVTQQDSGSSPTEDATGNDGIDGPPGVDRPAGRKR